MTKGGLPAIDFRCRGFRCSDIRCREISDSELEILRQARDDTRTRNEPATRAVKSRAIAKQRDARKTRRCPRILDCRWTQRGRRHVAQRRARQAREERSRPGTSWQHSTPDLIFGFYEAAWVRASSKVEKRMCWPLISERSSCQSSLGIFKKTSTTAGSNWVPEQRRISSRAESKPRALR